ncbi:MAG: zinc-ribbon domain-containing protein [Deltaproteobacteria bacterium]|nr:zinc-ribbon domain-containing protein [Deltaproteobacteria bacterium]
MKFECDSCHAQYMIADEKVGKRGVKVKCKKCQHVIIVRPGKHGDKAAAKDAVDKANDRAAAEDARASERDDPPASDIDDGRTELSVSAAVPPPPPPPDDSTQAGAAPDGLDALRAAVSDGAPTDDQDPFRAGEHSAFAAGGPTDPAVAALAPPPPPPEPEPTGNHRAPAPISMFGDTTQLSAQAQAPSEPDGEPSVDRTELGAPPQMTVPPPVADEPVAAKAAPPPNEDLLSDQLSGAFNAMFDAQGAAMTAPEAPQDDHRGPTRVLDVNAMAALRKKTAQRTAEGTLDDSAEGPMGLANGPPPDQPGDGFVVKPPAGADDGPADQVWHVAIDEQEVGPLSIAEIGRHIEGGRVDRDSLVWKMGMDNWEPAADVPEIRALFDKVPMPRISVEDDRPRARASAAPDLGTDFGDSEPGSGKSPFDEQPDDPAWRPHGLTDVYQAANLAEAAAGMGLGSLGATLAPKASSSSPPLAAQASAEPEWRPGAASALASLAQDEIKRMDSPLPPADDDLRPADDASLNAPMFGGLGAKPDLDAGPEITDPMASRPPLAPRSGYEPPPVAPTFPPQAGFQTRPPADGGRKPSPLVIGGIAGGGGLLLVISVLVVVMATRGGDEPKKVVGPDGKAYVMVDGQLVPIGGGAEAKPEVKPELKPETKTAPTPGASADPLKDPAAPPDAADKPPALAVSDKPPEAGDAAASPSAPDADVDKAPEKAPPKKATPIAKKVDKSDKAPKPPPVVAAAKAPGKGCDPVLDFDCKPGGTATKRPPQDDASLPDTPSKAEVLVAVKGALPKVAACGKKTGQTGMISIGWTIAPNGKVTTVNVKDKFAGTPTGSCVAEVVKALKFPASKKGVPVNYPMKLN